MNEFKDKMLARFYYKFNALKTDKKISFLKCSKKNLEKKKYSN